MPFQSDVGPSQYSIEMQVGYGKHEELICIDTEKNDRWFKKPLRCSLDSTNVIICSKTWHKTYQSQTHKLT